jgi:hypothetical protein
VNHAPALIEEYKQLTTTSVAFKYPLVIFLDAVFALDNQLLLFTVVLKKLFL